MCLAPIVLGAYASYTHYSAPQQYPTANVPLPSTIVRRCSRPPRLYSTYPPKVNMSQQGIRKYPRFVLRQPGAVVVQSQGELRKFAVVTENMSRGGALFTSASSIPEGTKIELTVYFRRTMAATPLELQCSGRVLRVEPRPSANGFAMAVEFENPLPPELPGKVLH